MYYVDGIAVNISFLSRQYLNSRKIMFIMFRLYQKVACIQN